MIGRGGAGCESFDASVGELGPVNGTLASAVLETGWRRGGRFRFVPPEDSTRWSDFVQWRREDGAWVVDAIGDDHPYTLPLLGRRAEMISRDTTLMREGQAYAAGTEWFRDNESLMVDGLWYVKYVPPRRLEQDALVRVGVRDRVGVYVEVGADGRTLDDVLFVPAAPGEFQPYMGFGRDSCG